MDLGGTTTKPDEVWSTMIVVLAGIHEFRLARGVGTGSSDMGSAASVGPGATESAL